MVQPIPKGWEETTKEEATHLFNGNRPWTANGSAMIPIADGTMDYPYGLESGVDQDLVDRGHAGWVRVRRIS